MIYFIAFDIFKYGDKQFPDSRDFRKIILAALTAAGATMRFREGQRVAITYKDMTVNGELFMISATGMSLALKIDAGLGDYENFIPVLWLESGYRDLLWARPVIIASGLPTFGTTSEEGKYTPWT